MSVAEVRPQIRAQVSLGALQPPGRGLLRVIYFSSAVSLFLVCVLEFLITSKELVWDSHAGGSVVASLGRLVPAVHHAAGLEDAQGLQAARVPLLICLPSISSQTPRKELFFSFASPTAKLPSVTQELAFGSASPRPSPALREQPQL